MLRKTLEEKRQAIRTYIKQNTSCTYKEIRQNTKLKIERIYKNMNEAYVDAGVKLSKNLTKRNKEQQKQAAINFIKANPGCTVTEIQNKNSVNVSLLFGTIESAYKAAGVSYIHKEIFWGVTNPSVVRRCKIFEQDIIRLLSSFGDVKPKIRTSAGIIDCILKYKEKIFVVEIKNYKSKNNNVSMHEIKQLHRYMVALNCPNGLLICPKESFPKRRKERNIYIGSSVIKILSPEEIGGGVI